MTASYYAGSRLTTATFNNLYDALPRVYYKASDQVYQSSTSLVNDTDLVVSLKANSTYVADAYLCAVGQSASTGDIDIAWSIASDATGNRTCFGPSASNGNELDTNVTVPGIGFTTRVTYGTVGSTTNVAIHENLFIITTTAATLTLRHAQATSNANNTGLRNPSRLIVTKVA